MCGLLQIESADISFGGTEIRQARGMLQSLIHLQRTPFLKPSLPWNRLFTETFNAFNFRLLSSSLSKTNAKPLPQAFVEAFRRCYASGQRSPEPTMFK